VSRWCLVRPPDRNTITFWNQQTICSENIQQNLTMSEHHDASPPKKRQRQSSADWYLYPAAVSRKFPVGSRVFVKPKSAKELGRRGTVVVDDDESTDDGKIKIRFDDRNNEEKKVILKRIFPIFSTTTTCLVTPDTASYRNLASSQLSTTSNR
jgi:hypothetical protein